MQTRHVEVVMKFSIRFADQIVGALVVLALAILVVVIFMLGRSQRWFVKDFEYKTYFNSASGLSQNMSILYRGFTIGHVKKITLTPDDNVEVVFIIFDEHNHRVREGSVVELQASPIGLGNAFYFHPGLGTARIEEGSLIPEINSPQARALIARGLVNRAETSDSIGNIINSVSVLLETINVSLAGSPGAEDLTIGQMVRDLQRTIANINEVTLSLSNQINPILTDVGTMVADISEQVNPIIANVGTITDQAASPTGTVMSILDAEGPVFTSIAEVLSSITSAIKNLERTIEFIPAQLPQISFMLSDLSSALIEAEKLIVALNNNPLLRGGVPEIKATGPGAVTPRDLEF